MFGRTPEDGDCGAARGRVFFEDAQLHPGSPEPPVQAIPKHLLLAGPKPTTYQHYLVQKATDRPDGILHWDGNYNATNTSAPVLRGFKRYWHRAPKSLPTSALATKSTSTVRLANSGCTFRARIRVENLSTEELGALLTAIELPTGCAHQLGMGKPIGLGSFETRLLSITRCDRKKRYEELFDRDSTWCTGSAAPLPPPRRQAFMDYFAFWMGRSNSARLWATPRMIELKALLSLENRDKPGWENATRYLEIERPTNGGKVNEYKKPGKVRALPPAGDVWRMGREIPRD
jgi:CRISPR-associated protein (TIGR03986 family)